LGYNGAMSNHAKYYLLVADTLESRQRHREHIEEALQNPALTPDERQHLEEELLKAKRSELEASEALEKQGEGSGDKEGKGGGAAGGKGGSGGKGKGEKDDGGDEEVEGEGGDGGLGDTEMTALLFFSADNAFLDVLREDGTETTFEDASDMLGDSVAAATIMFDHDEGIAHVHEPYMAGDDHGRDAFLPLIEQHAASRGAQSVVLNVHAGAVDLYRRRHGYEVVAKTTTKYRLVQMRKKLTPTILSKPEYT